jgi:hypothetical protein
MAQTMCRMGHKIIGLRKQHQENDSYFIFVFEENGYTKADLDRLIEQKRLKKI